MHQNDTNMKTQSVYHSIAANAVLITGPIMLSQFVLCLSAYKSPDWLGKSREDSKGMAVTYPLDIDDLKKLVR